MKRFLVPIIFILCLTGCEEEDPVSLNSPLESCYALYLNFHDNHLFGEAEYVYPPLDSGKNQITFEYQDDRIVRVTGGFGMVPSGYGTMENLIFSERIYDSIVHQENQQYVYSRPGHYYRMDDQPEKPIIYHTNEKGHLLKVTRRTGQEFYYAWKENTIVERTRDEETIRTFYMAGGNLMRVETITTRNSEEPWQKEEMIFTGYDRAPNPLRNKYHILGAFYRAFSQNNYSKLTIHSYHWEEGSWARESSSSVEVSMYYNELGQPLLGEYNGSR